MIPKIVHYCWFGKNPKPASFYICLESWKNALPDYEIMEWNESNFDTNCCEYVRLAAENKKWAFVSDYSRALALYQYGGIYMYHWMITLFVLKVLPYSENIFLYNIQLYLYTFGLTILISWISFHTIEKMFLQIKKKYEIK